MKTTAAAPAKKPEAVYCESCYTSGIPSRRMVLAKWYVDGLDKRPICDHCANSEEIAQEAREPVGGQFYVSGQSERLKYVPATVTVKAEGAAATMPSGAMIGTGNTSSVEIRDGAVAFAVCERCGKPRHRGRCAGVSQGKRPKKLPEGALQPITPPEERKKKPGPKTNTLEGIGLAPGFAITRTTIHEWQAKTQRVMQAGPELAAIVEAARSMKKGEMLEVTPPTGIRAKPYRDRVYRNLRNNNIKAHVEMNQKINKVGIVIQ